MKNLAIALSVTFVFSGLVLAQNPTVPDYTKWKKDRIERADVNLNSEETILLVEFYSYHTASKVGQHVDVVYDKNGKPWLLLNMVEEETTSRGYLFERKNDVWVFVKEITSEEDLSKTFKDNYKLEFK